MKKLEDYEKDDWELIDTLWNVNLCRTKAQDLHERINRYIMECKWIIKTN